MAVVKLSGPFGPSNITLETGRLARQADGAVLVTQGDTVVLAARRADQLTDEAQAVRDTQRSLPERRVTLGIRVEGDVDVLDERVRVLEQANGEASDRQRSEQRHGWPPNPD